MATVQQSIILEDGEQIVLPAGARIDSYILDPGATLTSSCTETIPNGDEYECYRFDWAESDSPDPGALEDGEIESVEIGGTVYELHIPFGSSIASIQTAINDETGPLFYVYSGAKDSSYDDRAEYSIGVKIPSLIVSSVKFKIIGTGFTGGAYVIPIQIEDCACVASTSGGDQTETVCDEIV